MSAITQATSYSLDMTDKIQQASPIHNQMPCGFHVLEAPGEGPVSPELAWPEDGVGEQQSGGGLQVHQGLGRHRAWTSNCLL